MAEAEANGRIAYIQGIFSSNRCLYSGPSCSSKLAGKLFHSPSLHIWLSGCGEEDAPRPSPALCRGRPLCLPPRPMICHITASASFASFPSFSGVCRDSLCHLFAAATGNDQASSQRHDGIRFPNVSGHMLWRFIGQEAGSLNLIFNRQPLHVFDL
ncbi:uncharacterized protein LY79DRAFT_269150 [Colletotrichum navitas]|uniref:Uncharacterized protein n=1 Tax=Colletotrichum navitas TaxID=681940 RepID=A0AAD8PVN1_9PEZI|nr:uncharacterized protein LY79DRAFT_269150 [Colletotrichum navitas]KAK1585476.1 hypothetical protein LY79DRAFT_269150 [Colletotrichum navitas]